LLILDGIEMGGFDVFTSASGGAPHSFGRQLALGLLSAILGSTPLIGGALYASLYVVRMDRNRSELVTTTIGAFAPRLRRLSATRVTRVKSHRGCTEGASPVTPWISLHVTGRQLPYLLGLQAETIDRSAILGLARRSLNDAQCH